MKKPEPAIVLRYNNRIVEEAAEVEWYSGKERYTHPVRIKIGGVWEDVFHYNKSMTENPEKQRTVVFRCNIGDNRIVEIVLSYLDTEF